MFSIYWTSEEGEKQKPLKAERAFSYNINCKD